MIILINLAMTILITTLIGRAASRRDFPFRSWRQGGPRGGSDWLNAIFTVWNVYVIGATWLMLGPTVYGVVYGLMIIASFAAGWRWMELQAELFIIRRDGIGAWLRGKAAWWSNRRHR